MVKSMVRHTQRIERPELIRPSILPVLIHDSATLLDALGQMHRNHGGSLITVDDAGCLVGVIDEDLLREGLLRERTLDAPVAALTLSAGEAVRLDTPFNAVVTTVLGGRRDLFPVVDDLDRVVNAFTREQLHQLLAEDLPWDPRRDFTTLSASNRRPDAVARPWGFYRSLLTTAFTQAKLLSVAPGQELSLQKHSRREEYWTVVRGEGIFRLDDDRFPVRRGFTVHIPREAVHWIKNTRTDEALILVEVQAGDYFGEDDIVRLSDKYRRS